MLYIPEDKIERAAEIVSRKVAEIRAGDDWVCECKADVQSDGVWFHADESLNPDHVEQIARALVEELELDEPFCMSWAYLCGKPRLGEFGGGAFGIRRGHPTVWCDAMHTVEQRVRSMTNENNESCSP